MSETIQKILHNRLTALLIVSLVLMTACTHNWSSNNKWAKDDNMIISSDSAIIKDLFTMQTSNGKNVNVYIKIDTAQYLHTLYVNDKPMRFMNTGFEGYEDDPLDESDIFRMAYFKSPDHRSMYVMLKPSIAGSCDIFYKVHVYRIDLETSKVDFLFNCGALKLTEEGFMVANQVACVNEDENPCCADMRFTAQLVYFDFNGKEIKRGKVMKDNDIFDYFISDDQPEDDYVICYELNKSHNII